MTTQYSISVDWEQEYDNWSNIGQEVMQEFYADHPQEAEKDGHDLDENGQLKYLDEILKDWQPMMMYAYPLIYDPTLFDDGTKRIIKVCRETCLTVMYRKNTDEYYLALCGGGMNLSQSIARAYQILETWIPTALLREVSKQPELSIYGDEWLEMAQQIEEQLNMEIDSIQRDLKQWQTSIAEYRKRITERSKGGADESEPKI
jgi:hypothetical protein